MVTSQEVTRWLLREISADAVLLLYKEVLKHGDMTISMNEKLIAKHIAYEMMKEGASEDKAKQYLRDVGFKNATPEPARGSALNAIRLFGDAKAALKMCQPMPMRINVTRRIVERILIERLAEAGYSNAKIGAMTGFCKRRIERVKKKIREEKDD